MKKQLLKSDEVVNGFKLAQNTKEDVILEVAIGELPHTQGYGASIQ